MKTNKLTRFALIICTLIILAGILLFGMGYDKFLPTLDRNLFSKQGIKYTKQAIQTAVQAEPVRTPVDWSQVTIDKVMVYKTDRRVDLLEDGKVITSYQMRLGFTPIGHKTTEGDGKTPEGKYTLDWRNPNSQFYRSFHVSYPNQQDLAQAKARGVSAGGDIMIHGSAKKTGGSKGEPLYNYLPRKDWTWGCIAIRNSDMDEMWDNVKNGTEIEILP